jgi:hypothetical protein
MIGDAPTAGMSATKKEITPPSRLFTVRIAVGSNKQRFNGGAGIEGLGVPPHESVAVGQESCSRRGRPARAARGSSSREAGSERRGEVHPAKAKPR